MRARINRTQALSSRCSRQGVGWGLENRVPSAPGLCREEVLVRSEHEKKI